MKKIKFGEAGKRQFLLIGLFCILLLMLAVRVPTKFFSAYNMQSMAQQLPELGLIALGMLLVVITGGIDLSITYTASLGGVVGAMYLVDAAERGTNLAIAICITILIMIGVSALCGALKGYLIAIVHVHPWLVTLGMMSLLRGIAIILTHGGSISGLPKAFYKSIGNMMIFGVPLIFIILIVITVILGFLLHRTVWGRTLKLIGSNRKVSQYTGLPVNLIIFTAYILSSVIAGISGMIMVSRYNSAKVDHGSTYLMQSITIIVMSGADINGGTANIFSMFLTMLLMQVMYTGTSMLGGNRYTVVVLNGIMLIGILLLNAFLDSRIKKREVRELRLQGTKA